MGLSVSHGCWDGAYSSFSRWRNKLCEAAGWHLEEQEAEYGFKYTVPREINWDAITESNLNGDWEETPEDPLVILIAHYDCDGFIRHPHTAPLAERLRELQPAMQAAGDGGGHVGLYGDATDRFIKGLWLAHQCSEDVAFR